MSSPHRNHGKGKSSTKRTKRTKHEKRGAPLRTRAGTYSPLPTFFDAFPSFTRDTRQTPDRDFRLLQERVGWKAGSTIYKEMRRKFLTALVADTKSPVHAYFVNHTDFLEYDSTASPHVEFSRLEHLSKSPVDRVAFDAAFRAEFNGPLDSFFHKYPEFKYNPRGTHMAEFRRLVAAKRWDPERAKQEEHRHEQQSREYNSARTAFFDAFRDEFDYLFGGNSEDFSTWQKLCTTLGVEPMPRNVKECKTVTSPLMVNIYDITHHKRTGAPFDFFNTLADLRSYTIEKELFFPKAKAKESALKFLMREILPRTHLTVRRMLR